MNKRQQAEEKIIEILEDHAELIGAAAEYVAGVIYADVIAPLREDEKDAWIEYVARKDTTTIH